MTISMLLLRLILLALLVAACGNQQTDNTDADTQNDVRDEMVEQQKKAVLEYARQSASQFKSAFRRGYRLGKPAGVQDLSDNDRWACNHDLTSYLDQMRSINEWQQGHNITKSFLSSKVQTPYIYELEQLTAYWMLREVLAQQPIGKEVQEATGFYTDLLLLNENPDVLMASEVLPRLEGFWNKDQLRKSARLFRERFDRSKDKADEATRALNESKPLKEAYQLLAAY